MALLEIKNLQKTFSDGVTIIENLSLSVKKGEVVVILGPSGCGKSTLLRCINGLEKIQGGEILLDGELISNRKKDMHLIRQKIGMVFQSYELFPHLTVLKNILLAPVKVQKRNPAEVKNEAEQLLKRIGLIDKKIPFRANFQEDKNNAQRLSAPFVCILKSCFLTKLLRPLTPKWCGKSLTL